MSTPEGDSGESGGITETLSNVESSIKNGVADAAERFNDLAVDLPLVGDGPITSTGAAAGNKFGGAFGSVVSKFTGDEVDQRLMRNFWEAWGRTASEAAGFVLSGSSSKLAKGVSIGAKALGAAGVADRIDPSIDEDRSASSWEEKTAAWDEIRETVESEYDGFSEMLREENGQLLENAGGNAPEGLSTGRG